MNQPSDPRDRRDLLERAIQAVETMQARLDAIEREKREAIAIIGMGCRFPGHATSPEAYWKLLYDGVDAIHEIPSDRWEVDTHYNPDPDSPGKMYSRKGGFLDEVDKFDALFFGVAPREVRNTDPQHRLLLEVTWEALENAAVAPAKLQGSRTGVFVGITNNDYARIVERGGLEAIDAYHLIGNCLNFAAGRISHVFGLHGPTMSVDTACSSSGVTIHLACQSLRNKECDLALSGGVNLILSPELSISSTKARTLSPEGSCKTFDSSADGYVRSEGCGMVVLKRLSDALAAQDNILAVIRGSAVSHDGASSGITVPNKLAQEGVIRQALERAGVEPNQVDYVEAHGTGTSLGDPIEVRALASVYSRERSQQHPLAIGTAKTNVGHLESAAGIAGLIKVVLSLQHGIIPAHLHFKKLNPAIALDHIPAVIPLQRMPWPRGVRARVAGLSFFGGSGTIGHMIVEEAPERPSGSDRDARTPQLLCLSAKTSAALNELTDRYEAYLADAASAPIADVCYSANTGRSHFKHRIAVVGSTKEELRAGLAGRGADRAVGTVSETGAPKVAFLFTGQPEQVVTISRHLYEDETIFQRAIDRCDEWLRAHESWSLRSVMEARPGDSAAIDDPQYQQVAMFAVQCGLAALWRSWGVEPSVVMGHGIGEIAAATVAGQMSVEDGLKLVREIGRLMQSLSADMAMASLIAHEDRVSEAMSPYRDRVAIAAVNGPKNTVISGERAAVHAIVNQLAAAGIEANVPNVLKAFHSPQIEPVLAEFEQRAREVHYTLPQIALFSSTTLKMAAEGNLMDAAYWRQSLRDTVRFSDAVRKLYEQGHRLFVEIGPSPVLVKMGSQSVPNGDAKWLPSFPPSLRRDGDDGQPMAKTLMELYVHGVEVNWAAFYEHHRANKVALPTYPFQRERHWVDSLERIEQPAADLVTASPEAGHPLLGGRLRSAVPIFERQLSAKALPFLRDHRVFGQIILPATAYLELALAAGMENAGGKQIAVRDVVFAQPLMLPGDEVRTIQVTISELEPGLAAFKIFSLRPGNDENANQAWVLHATGHISRAEEDDGHGSPGIKSIAAIQRRCTNKVEIDSYYASLRAHGLEFGPCFRGIEELLQEKGEALALIRLPVSLNGQRDRYILHPALMDACLQPVLSALPEVGAHSAEGWTYLPQRLQSVRVYRRPGDQIWSHIRVRKPYEADATEFVADFDLIDPAGERVCEVRGLVFHRAERDAIASLTTESLNDLVYELKWEEMPGRVRQVEKHETFMPSPVSIAQALVPHSRRASTENGLQEFVATLPRLEALSTAYVWQALRELGWNFQQNQTFTTESAARDLWIPKRFHRLLARMFEMLEQDGCLSRESGRWKVVQVPHGGNPEEELSAILREHPACSAEAILVGRCGRHFARAMRGEVEPLELLFPNGSLEDMERLYRDSPYFRFYNGVIREAVQVVVEQLSPNRPLRILEVGAGTGSTTSFLLPKLPPQQAEYLFTDVSPLFLSKARQALADYPFVDYRILDIEKNPSEQGLNTHSFDLIIAANALHATKDLRETLQHVRTLLSTEGLFMLLEATRPLRYIDLIVGLTDGWWRFSDLDLRPSHPLLSEDKWRGLLAESGFKDVSVLPERDEGSVLSNQVVILAGDARAATRDRERLGPGTAPSKDRYWLLFADQNGLAKGLRTTLESHGESCCLVSAGKHFEERGEGSFEIDPTRSEDFQQLLRKAGSDHRTLAGVIYLWALSDADRSFQGLETLKGEIQRGCGSLLHLVNSLASGGITLPNGLWIVTRGAQSVDSDSGLTSLSQAPAAAMGATIGLEYPELRCTRIDLDLFAVPGEAETLYEEFANEEEEDLIAYREGRRFVARLDHIKIKADSRDLSKDRATGTDQPYPYDLGISGAAGVLDNLSLRLVDRRPPGPGEVEIEVQATGLGFRDVLMALGRYPGPSDVFGYECAGRIVRLGNGVEQFHLGERVMAVGPGSFSAFMTISVDRIIPIPEHLQVHEAATLPSAFLTAHYALSRLGRIAVGEKVLIHAAAGGVGLAAVQLAQRAGAEIFATAGSPEKRKYLESLGVPHVMDSRSLDFAQQILKITAGRGVDIVLNCLSGEFIAASFSVTARGGRFLEIGRTEIWDEPKVAQLNKNISYFPIDLASIFDQKPQLIRELFEALIPDFARGILKPPPFRTFPVTEAISAFRFMAQARHIGKIVVSHPGSPGKRTGSGYVKRGSACEIKPDATYLITGGLGGLGLLVARWMSEQGAKHLVLSGRSGPSEPALSLIREIEEKGTRIVPARGDVSDRAYLVELFSRFGQSLPPLRGIVHSAGIVDDGALGHQTWERFEKVMAPKVDGAWWLHTLSQDQPLDFFILFSSAVSMLGSTGQANHVAACAFEDALAHYRSNLGLPALSINWGPWSEVGAATRGEVSRSLQKKGFRLMESKRALRILGELLSGNRVQAGVISVDWRQYVNSLPPQSRTTLFSTVLSTGAIHPPEEERKTPQMVSLRDQISRAPRNKRRPLLEAHIREQVIRVVGLKPSFKLDINQGLSTLGMDSLMAIELKNCLQVSAGKSLPSTIVFDHPTVAALAEYLERNVLMTEEDSKEKARRASAPVEQADFSELDQLSEEDAEAMLAKELSGLN